jgi:uncharacterized protein with HEPN domain
VKSERNPADYVGDMLEASGQIAQFIKGMTFEEFSADRKTQFAVIRGLEIIGEAIRNISPPLRQKYSKIPWREITGMRDRLIHDYVGVNVQIVWNAATKNLPAIEPELRRMLDELGG